MPLERVGALLERSAARHPGLVIAVRSGARTGVWTRGGLKPGSVFEIGSITKTFTGLLLADLEREGLVAFSDPVARYLPVAPPVKGREITLEDLATHTSGLPRLPRGMLIAAYTRDRKDPYANVDLPAAIPASPPKRAPGGRAVYSNYGMGLLGYALARRAGLSYGDLVRERITTPLALHQTALDTPGLVQGHTRRGKPTPPWNLAGLAGAGGLRSTAGDLLDYLALHSRTDIPLAAAAREARRPRAKLGGAEIGLAWLILPAGKGLLRWRLEHDIVLHEGGTGGFRTFAATVPDTADAVVVLANQARSAGRLGMKILKALHTSTPPGI
jgi:CubicO group peptidase (beta-lactamase class C family)